MKYISLIITFTLFSTCCGSNQTAHSPEKTPTVVVEAQEEVNESPETIPPVEDTTEIKALDVTSVNIEGETAADEQTETFDHYSWHNLLQKYVTTKGNVNYKGFKKEHTLLKNYITSLGKNMPTNNWGKEDRLAFWINAYNALTVDLVLRNYPLKSIKDIDKPWKQRLWQLGNKWYNLDEIEHQILRKMNEPRIHFGIVCASFSCPKLLNEAFTANALDTQLTNATKDFLSDSKRNNISENELKLSRIFQWFAKDFKHNGSLIDFLNQYSDVTISPKAKKRYKDYNWALNE